MKTHLSVINKGLSVEGTVSSRGKLVIKGIVKGSLKGQDILVAQEGAVFADVQAEHLVIGGELDGTAEISGSLTVLSTGQCKGQVQCRTLHVEPGGVLNARVVRMDGHLK